MESIKKQPVETAILHYVQGRTTPDEEKILHEWMQENPENRKLLFRERDLWQASNLADSALSEVESDNWTELRNRIHTREHKAFQFKRIFRYAAIVIIAMGTGWLGRSLYSSDFFEKGQPEYKTVKVSKGQIKEIFLADGTHVWLNSDSQISFPSEFSDRNREVELSGEAYFEVTASEESPFLVRTKNHTVKVTGTRFNICEYPESKIIETTLEEGKVKIITGSLTKDLWPGQQSSFHTETSKIRISEPDFEVYTAWREGRYDFKNEPVSKVFKIIERWWDVKIDYPEEAFENERISGVLRRYKPLEQHFNVIRELVPFDYKVERDLISVIVRI